MSDSEFLFFQIYQIRTIISFDFVCVVLATQIKNMAEAKARIKINKLLEESGWRFFEEGGKPANIELEPKVKIIQTQLD